jgi:hypothetical protein
MRRSTTALVALLAVVAFAGAAGTFDAAESPTPGIEGSGPGPEQGTAPQAGTGESGPSAEDGGGLVDRPSSDVQQESRASGGTSPVLVAVVLGAVLVGGVLILVLTDDDRRAPDRSDRAESDTDPLPSIRPTYGDPPDSDVVRAWERVLNRVGGAEESTTPREVAARPSDRETRSVLESLSEAFEAVRYGREPTTADRRAVARTALGAVETVDAADAADAADVAEEAGDS